MMPSIKSLQGPISALNTASANAEILRLNTIENIDIISRILAAAVYRMNRIHPYDYCIGCLGIKIEKLQPTAEEFLLVNKFVFSEKSIREQYKILNVFAVERKGEDKRISKWANLKNNRLLWHGTETENCLGILNQGLRVAPDESYRTGGSLGNGIYFSERFSHAADFSSGRFSKSQFIFL